jgi:hypothetical protein
VSTLPVAAHNAQKDTSHLVAPQKWGYMHHLRRNQRSTARTLIDWLFLLLNQSRVVSSAVFSPSNPMGGAHHEYCLVDIATPKASRPFFTPQVGWNRASLPLLPNQKTSEGPVPYDSSRNRDLPPDDRERLTSEIASDAAQGGGTSQCPTSRQRNA